MTAEPIMGARMTKKNREREASVAVGLDTFEVGNIDKIRMLNVFQCYVFPIFGSKRLQ